MVHVDGFEQLSRLLVLHENASEAIQHIAEHTAPRSEKDLAIAENGRNEIGGDIAAPEFAQIIAPKFVFHKNCHCGIHQIEESVHLSGQIERQIAHHIRQIVVLPHLVATGREKAQHNVGFRVFLFDALHERSSLLKFAERGSMYPNVAVCGIEFFTQQIKRTFLSFQHGARLLAAQCSQANSQLICFNS